MSSIDVLYLTLLNSLFNSSRLNIVRVLSIEESVIVATRRDTMLTSAQFVEFLDLEYVEGLFGGLEVKLVGKFCRHLVTTLGFRLKFPPPWAKFEKWKSSLSWIMIPKILLWSLLTKPALWSASLGENLLFDY